MNLFLKIYLLIFSMFVAESVVSQNNEDRMIALVKSTLKNEEVFISDSIRYHWQEDFYNNKLIDNILRAEFYDVNMDTTYFSRDFDLYKQRYFGLEMTNFYSRLGNQLESYSYSEAILKSNGELESIVFYESYSSVFKPSFKRIYEYTSEGRLSFVVKYYWNYSTEEWQEHPSNRLELIYDSEGFPTVLLQRNWDNNANDWSMEPWLLREWEYDTNGRLIDVRIYEIYGETIIPEAMDHRFSIEYNGNGDVSEVIRFYNHNYPTPNWAFSVKYNLFYDVDGQLVRQEIFEYQLSDWQLQNEGTYVYSGSNLVESILTSTIGGLLAVVEKKEYDYGELNQLNEVVVWSINFDNELVPMDRLHYEYDNVHRLRKAYAESMPFGSSEWESSTYLNTLKFYYEDDVANYENQSQALDFTVYPNPSHSDIHVKMINGVINSMEILDLCGRRVFSTKQKMEEQQVLIPTDQFEKGTYFVKVTSGHTTESKKIVLE